MTTLEKMVWAAAYAESLARRRAKGLGSHRGCVRDAIREADESVLAMRDIVEVDGRLHRSSETLEQERLSEEA